jgi:hypothetical protein
MTYLEFRYSLANNLLQSTPRTLIVNFNEIPGSSPAKATIDDIAILIEGNLSQLQEATSISLNIPEAGGIVNINVEPSTVPLRDMEKGVVGPYYCYSILTPGQRPIIALPAPDVYDTDVIIEPITATGAYNYNTYNPLIGNTSADRESSYRVYCDRGTTTPTTKTNPVNIFSILSDQAVHANVQDSLYSDTGWTHGRYEGSKLTPDNNHGVDPVLPGTFFEGAFFGSDVTDAYIQGLNTSDLTFLQYLSSGKEQVPQYAVQDLKLSLYSITSTTARVATPNGVPPASNILLKPGDLFLLSGSTGFTPEVMQMINPTSTQQYYPYEAYILGSNYEDKTLRVTRGYSGTTVSAVTPNYPNAPMFYRIDPVKIYSIEGTVVQVVDGGKVLIRETGDILHVSQEGLVISGSSRVVL